MSTPLHSVLVASLVAAVAADPWRLSRPEITRIDVEDILRIDEAQTLTPAAERPISRPGPPEPGIIIVVPVETARDEGSGS